MSSIDWPRPHSFDAAGYGELLVRLRRVVMESVEEGSNVIVVNKGDEALVQLDGCNGWHFPRREDGSYLGFLPTDSMAAIANLEELRARGAQYLVLPASLFWWLEHYPQFAEHLQANYRLIARDDSTCLIFRLREPQVETELPPRTASAHFDRQLERYLDALLPTGASVLVAGSGDLDLAELPRRHAEGVRFLVLADPATALEAEHDELAAALARHFRQVARQAGFCAVYDLSAPAQENGDV